MRLATAIARAVGTPDTLVLAFEDRAVTAFDVSWAPASETLQAKGLLAGWLGKGRGMVARLAAVLALLDWTANRPSNALPPTVIRSSTCSTPGLCGIILPAACAGRVRPCRGLGHGGQLECASARRVIGWIRTRRDGDLARRRAARALSQKVKAAGADEVIGRWRAGVLREIEDDERLPAPRPPAHAASNR